MSSATFHFPTPAVRVPLPWGYYGSVVHFTRVRADLDAGLPAVAAALDRHVAGVPEDELWRAVEWLHARQQQEGGGVRRGSADGRGSGSRRRGWMAATGVGGGGQTLAAAGVGRQNRADADWRRRRREMWHGGSREEKNEPFFV